MSHDLKMIKKKYSEKMMHLCRELFPTILEEEGTLFRLLSDNFHYRHSLYQDLVDNDKINSFSGFIYKKYYTVPEEKPVTNLSPEELLAMAGYDLYECYTKEDIEKFMKYYAPGEELCTFKVDRLKNYYVFFAVKKNVDKIKRENFSVPRRQDAYGTSVISIQYMHGDYNELSIKNRYNDTVADPDSTFSNDLDNIVPGLSYAFEKKYHLSNRYDFKGFQIPGYVLAKDGKYYKYNYVINNIYYCTDNIIIDNSIVVDKYQDKEKYLVIDYFVIDLVNKKVEFYKPVDDEFVDSFNDISKINIQKNKADGIKTISFDFDNGKRAVIEINKYNQMVSYYNENVIKTDGKYLYENKYLDKVSFPNALTIADGFMSNNLVLSKIFLPKVKNIGSFFLASNLELDKIYLQEVVSIKDNFLDSNKKIKVINFSNVLDIGNSFMEHNDSVRTVIMPKVLKIGDNFFSLNTCLEELFMPMVINVGNSFMPINQGINNLTLPCVIVVGNDFLAYNTTIRIVNLDRLEIVGDNFMYSNDKVNIINLLNVKFLGDNCFTHNVLAEYVNMPKVRVIGDNFLRLNKNVKNLDMSNVSVIGNNFCCSNQELESIIFENLKLCGNSFCMENKKIRYVYIPNVLELGSGFMYDNLELTELIIPKCRKVGSSMLRCNNSLKKFIAPELYDIDLTSCLINNETLEEVYAPHIGDKINYFDSKGTKKRTK